LPLWGYQKLTIFDKFDVGPSACENDLVHGAQIIQIESGYIASQVCFMVVESGYIAG
jgi:hypothetical protein